MLGNEPLSKWSLVTNSQSKLWGGMLMKCQSCHFISSNYRLACRPFNDHLQHCLQCIRGSTKSLPAFHFIEERTHTHTHAYIIMKLHKHRNTHSPPHTPLFLSQTPHFLFICDVQNKNSSSRLLLACQSKAEWNICNHNSSVPFNYTAHI